MLLKHLQYTAKSDLAPNVNSTETGNPAASGLYVSSVSAHKPPAFVSFSWGPGW